MAQLEESSIKEQNNIGVVGDNTDMGLTDHERIEALEKAMIQIQAGIDKKLWFIMGMSAILGIKEIGGLFLH